MPGSRIDQIVKLRRGVTLETALRLARYFGGNPEAWADWVLARAEKAQGKNGDIQLFNVHPLPLPPQPPIRLIQFAQRIQRGVAGLAGEGFDGDGGAFI